MLFNSVIFLLFLPIVFTVYWILAKNYRIQNGFVVLASYIFYGWWDWRFVGLILLTTFLSYTSGIGIDKAEKTSTKKLICGANIVVNLAILGFFKYFNFFAENFVALFQTFGYQIDRFTVEVILPVGISFYTFQALSYSIDVYRRQVASTTDFFAFASFLSFFPQLVAGPIEQSTNLLPQFQRARHFDYAQAVQGMRQILWGFFKKIVVADNCATLANNVFDNYEQANSPMLILGAIFFTFQIYGDFSGYSDIALGTAKLFGIELKKNFHYPYFSRDITEFWRRWHISLNKWFIQYVYIPLGGSRCTHTKMIRNTMVVFLLSGLWHGANWTFICWGLYNGLLLSLMTFRRHKWGELSEYSFFPPLKVCLRMISTFALVVIGWVIFRADSLTQACRYLGRIFTLNPLHRPNLQETGQISIELLIITLCAIALLQLVEWIQRDKEFALDLRGVHSRVMRWTIYLSLILIFAIFAGGQAEFIYFQF